jgi:hypothetical protein
MKKVYLLIFLLIPFISSAQLACNLSNHARAYQAYFVNSDYKAMMPNQYELEAAQHKKRLGTTLLIAGSVALVGGVALVSQADELYYNSNTTNGQTTNSGDPKGGFGVLFIAAGVGMIVPGAIIYSKGRKQYNAYQEQNTLSLHVRGAGLAFRWKL